ncbi:MAG: extracellular solute-binding protein [Paenibacillaceae bacterium]|nr:extracellular solute-binding protein [Paenibacillaceae bacterium]
MGKAWKSGSAIALVAALATLAACSGSKEPAADSAKPSAAPSAAATSPTPVEKVNPLAKYEPAITFTTVRKEVEGIKYPPGQNLDKNVWYDFLETDLGIKVVNSWKVPAAQWDQKMNVSIISGDLPDFMLVDPRQLQLLIDGGKLMDMTAVYDKYASPLLKELSSKEKMDFGTFKGKLMAIPAGPPTIDFAPILWIREDWRKKLNLPEPKTADDLLGIINAFTTKDPDGNGKNDTYGFNMHKMLYGTYSGIEGFLNMFKAYGYNLNGTTMWQKDASGKLVFSSIQPEMKTALGKLQELYKAGAIDKEFGVYDSTKSSENEMKGKTGVHFGINSNPGNPLRDFKKTFPEGEWKPYPLPSADGSKARPVVTAAAPTEYFVVNKAAKNPEALVKMLNYFYEKVVGPNADPAKYHTAAIDGTNYTVFQYAPIKGGIPNANLASHYAVVNALKSNDPGKLNAEQKGYFDTINQYRKGDLTQWFRDRIFGEEGSYGVIGYYNDNKLPMINEYAGPPTKTMVEKGSTLQDLEIQTFTKIIMGNSLDDFDKYVKDWKSLGGDAITQEVNDWYAGKK